MSVDALGQSPRRMAKAPPPPVPPKRFQVKDALHDLGVQPRSPTTPTITTPTTTIPTITSTPIQQEERRPSAAERLAADKGRFIKSQPIVLSKTPQMTAVPVARKKPVAPGPGRAIPPSPSKPNSSMSSSSSPSKPVSSSSISSSNEPPKASPRRPVRRAAPPAAGHSAGAPVLNLKHLSILISDVEEPEPEPDASPPASHAAAASSTCSLSSDGTAGEENCNNNEPAVPTPTTSEPTSFDSFDKLALASPASLAQVSSTSPSLSTPSLDSPWRAGAGSDASGSGTGSQSQSQGGCSSSPAVAVRRVDVRPQMAAPVRKGPMMHGGPHMHGRMPPAHMQMHMQMPMHMPIAAHNKLQQQAQSHAHLMYLMKAQVAAKNAPVLPRNSPLMPPGGVHGGMAGMMMAHRAGMTPSLPPQAQQPSSNGGSPTLKSPTMPGGGTPQPVSATTTPQSSAVAPITPPVPLRTSSPTAAGQAAEPQAPAATMMAATAAATPTPSSLPSSSSNLSSFLPGGGSNNSPIPPFSSAHPSPSPSITRLSSSGSRKRRPSLTRSKSDVSDRYSRAGADLERFFNYCGLDPADLDLEELAQQPGGSDIASVSRLRSASAPASECSQGQEQQEQEEEGGGAQAQRVPYGVSVIERNARVIKWLYGLRQARDPARVANV